MSVAGLVLAAGAGRRFGGPKAIALLDGQRLVDRALDLLVTAGCDPVVVVSGAVALEVPGARVVANPLWPSGMGSSLRVGLDALAGDQAEAVVVVLVDTPWLAAEAVRRLVQQGSAAPAAIATYDGRRGHPVLLRADVWDQVAALAVGDTAARAWLRANPARVVEVDCSGLGSPRDVDCLADLTEGTGRTGNAGSNGSTGDD